MPGKPIQLRYTLLPNRRLDSSLEGWDTQEVQEDRPNFAIVAKSECLRTWTNMELDCLLFLCFEQLKQINQRVADQLLFPALLTLMGFFSPPSQQKKHTDSGGQLSPINWLTSCQAILVCFFSFKKPIGGNDGKVLS